MQDSGPAVYQLAAVLQASPESDALVVLGRLLDSLPIGFHVSDCSDPFHILYANRVRERWLAHEKLPLTGKARGELFPGAAQAGILGIMREGWKRAQPKPVK